MHITPLRATVADREGRKQSQSTGRPVDDEKDDEEIFNQRLLLDGHGHELPELRHDPRLLR